MPGVLGTRAYLAVSWTLSGFRFCRFFGPLGGRKITRSVNHRP
jgi:hypothetical protein